MSRQWGNGFYAGLKEASTKTVISKTKLVARGSTVTEDRLLLLKLEEMRDLLGYYHICYLVRELYYDTKNSNGVYIYLNVGMEEGFLVGQTLSVFFTEIPFFHMEGADGEHYVFWAVDPLVFDEAYNKKRFNKIFNKVKSIWYGFRRGRGNGSIADGDAKKPF